MHSNSHYNKALRPFASKLRKEMTKAEACLWKYVLRAGGMKGYTFNRQRPVLDFIADFLCKELKLVIEVDGFNHTLEENYARDVRKDQVLSMAGFTVVRFTDEQVLKDIVNVTRAIEDKIVEIEAAMRTRRK